MRWPIGLSVHGCVAIVDCRVVASVNATESWKGTEARLGYWPNYCVLTWLILVVSILIYPGAVLRAEKKQKVEEEEEEEDGSSDEDSSSDDEEEEEEEEKPKKKEGKKKEKKSKKKSKGSDDESSDEDDEISDDELKDLKEGVEILESRTGGRVHTHSHLPPTKPKSPSRLLHFARLHSVSLHLLLLLLLLLFPFLSISAISLPLSPPSTYPPHWSNATARLPPKS